MLKFMIVADDLSGACDTAVQFRKFGYRTLVLNQTENARPLFDRFAAMAITTNSRDLEPDAARQAIRSICPFLKDLGPVALYKKIDSTWRGNIGAELEVMMHALELKFAVICSVFPENMRFGVGGYLLVDGRLLHHTAMARDPASPIDAGYLPDLLTRQTRLPVALLPINLIESGTDSVQHYIKEKIKTGPCLFIADATESDHLDTIAAIGSKDLPPFIFAGSAGLSAAILRQQEQTERGSSPPILSVIGSVHPKSIAQIDKLIETYNISQIYVPWEALLDSNLKALEPLCAAAVDLLSRRQDLVIRTCRGADDAEASVLAGKASGKNGAEVAAKVSEGIQRVVADILSETAIGGLMVTGGTTALKLLEGLSGEGIEVIQEIEPGVPVGRIVGGKLDDMKILTKAGGFGSPHVFCTGIEALKKEE
jgi:D-threonate/D-erythronate kinase